MALMNRARLELQSSVLTNKELAGMLRALVMDSIPWLVVQVDPEDILIIDDMEPEEV